MIRALPFRLLTLGALLSAGCHTSTCDNDEDSVTVDAGYINADKTMYESSRLNVDNLVYFPPNRTLVFVMGKPGEGLRNVPSVNVYLSFTEHPSSTIAMTAGNAGLIRVLTADRIEIKNDTCSEYYVWLTATASDTPYMRVDAGSAGAGEATGEAGAGP